MKKAFAIIIILSIMMPFALTIPAAAKPQPGGVTAVAPWPQKADWVGQQATIYPAKLYASASYLLVYPQPGQSIAGVDQLYFARKFLRQTFAISGLYKIAAPAPPHDEYYWRLDDAGGATVWVKDTSSGQLAALPFALNSELAAEHKAIADINALAGAPLWLDRNVITTAELSAPVGHLVPVTVTAFKTTGPFSDTYALVLALEDGSSVVWATATTGTGDQTVYSNGHFLVRVRKGLHRENPRTSFPKWSEELWTLIKGREIRTGWDQDMVKMSWGDPETIEKVLEGPDKDLMRWRYGSTNLFFRDKLLAKIRIPDPALAKLKPTKDDNRKTAKDDGRKTAKDAPKKKDPNYGLIEVTVATKEPRPADGKGDGKSADSK